LLFHAMLFAAVPFLPEHVAQECSFASNRTGRLLPQRHARRLGIWLLTIKDDVYPYFRQWPYHYIPIGPPFELLKFKQRSHVQFHLALHRH
jgi:hypothetical protein